MPTNISRQNITPLMPKTMHKVFAWRSRSFPSSQALPLQQVSTRVLLMAAASRTKLGGTGDRVRSSGRLAGTFQTLAEDDTIDPGTCIVLHDRYPRSIRHALELKAQSLMKPNRASIFRVGDGSELSTASGDGKAGEVVIELPGEAKVAVGRAYGDQVDVGYRLRVRDKTEEIRHDFLLIPDDEGTVSEFVDEHGVMQGPIAVVTPEIRQFRDDLIVVMLRAARDVHMRATPSCMPANDEYRPPVCQDARCRRHRGQDSTNLAVKTAWWATDSPGTARVFGRETAPRMASAAFPSCCGCLREGRIHFRCYLRLRSPYHWRSGMVVRVQCLVMPVTPQCG
jgi:hypothetical protein